MKTILLNSSTVKMPRQFINAWLQFLRLEYSRQRVQGQSRLRKLEIVVVFLNSKEAKALNKQFRGKDYATDVLSFSSEDPESLGELILCPQVLQKQAKAHGLTFRQELAYMLCHGVLHLLDYDHEGSAAQAEAMYALQDKAFAQGLRKIRTK